MLTVKTPEEVLALIDEEFSPLDGITEPCHISEACGRALAEDICACEYVPDFDRSTVDGYAVRACDTFGCSDSMPAVLRLAGEIKMGEGAELELKPDECCAVPTGGAVPSGADSVVMLEYVESYGDGTVGIGKPAAPGMNMIFRGDDVFPGKPVLRKGRVLTPQDIGALAAIGTVSIPAVRRLRVAVISTGDELVSPDEAPGPGQVRNVNGPMLCAMLESFGAKAVDLGIIADDEAMISAAVDKAVADCDAVLISGGSSVGVKDAACRIISSKGRLLLHGIAIKPGKPTILGKCFGKPVVGLPGHPVAACFVTRLFVFPLLSRLMGIERREYTVPARISESISANHGRAQYLCCRLVEHGGELTAVPVRGKAGLITQLAGTDGYFCIDRDCEGLPCGAVVQVTVEG